MRQAQAKDSKARETGKDWQHEQTPDDSQKQNQQVSTPIAEILEKSIRAFMSSIESKAPRMDCKGQRPKAPKLNDLGQTQAILKFSPSLTSAIFADTDDGQPNETESERCISRRF